jgi:hypothetical protein
MPAETLVVLLVSMGAAGSVPRIAWVIHAGVDGATVHRATEVLGDPTEPETPARIRAFVNQALQEVRTQVSAQLLIQLPIPSSWRSTRGPGAMSMPLQGDRRRLCP